jgi:hypothetical protein
MNEERRKKTTETNEDINKNLNPFLPSLIVWGQMN